MLAELQATAAAYALNDWLLGQLVADFTAQDWAAQDACGHDPRWLAGHLATYRRRALALLGATVEPLPWEAAFVRGKGAADLPADLDPAAVVAAFHAAQADMVGRWDGLDEAALARPAGRRLPDGSENVGGAIRFLAWHETYHLGQLGLLRRLAGKPGVA